MNAAAVQPWQEANQRYLLAALALVRAALERHAARSGGGSEPMEQDSALQQQLAAAARDMPAPPALERLCTLFGLSRFERDVLLLCAGMELDSAFVSLCAAAQGDTGRPYPTFSLALAVLQEPHWSALTPVAPLRHWRLIEVAGGSTLTLSPLRIDERVLHYLAGIQHLDERLAGLVEPVRTDGETLVPSYRALAERLAMTWSQAPGEAPLPVMQLCGTESTDKQAIAAAACAALGLNLNRLAGNVILLAPLELDTLRRLWEREAALSTSALLLDCEQVEATDTARAISIARWIEQIGSPLIVSCRERRPPLQRPLITFDVGKPSASEQCSLWEAALGTRAAAVNGQLEVLVSQFNLSTAAIQSACAEVLGEIPVAAPAAKPVEGTPYPADPPAELPNLLWAACRRQARPHLEDLAQRIEPAATWDELILPELQRRTLREIAIHIRHRARVYGTWGFAAKGTRGLGISTLFAGPSGTGKTMAAEVLANELRLDLYRIDLSQVVSKYIGETEKNLRRVFDAAEDGGVILLFDEADALFGKRSEVKDSHDRYANIEVSYLLQRMEAYRGLAILTTNLKSALDQAFLRRIRFVVQFPFPDAAQRAEIWRQIFPSATPLDGLDLNRLARLNVAGGNIRNIALNAAFLAADAGEPVRMSHLLQAARSEYAKLEKPLADAEIGGWQ